MLPPLKHYSRHLHRTPTSVPTLLYLPPSSLVINSALATVGSVWGALACSEGHEEDICDFCFFKAKHSPSCTYSGSGACCVCLAWWVHHCVGMRWSMKGTTPTAMTTRSLRTSRGVSFVYLSFCLFYSLLVWTDGSLWRISCHAGFHQANKMSLVCFD